jgi:conjugative transfer region protein TrbK
MDGKLLARIGAAVFVGLAVAVALVQLRGEPQSRAEPGTAVWVPDGDPLPAQLRTCRQMGELALSSADCRAAWAEKRRRFFGVDYPGAYSGIVADAAHIHSHNPALHRSGED